MEREWVRRYWKGLCEYIQQKGIQLQELPPRADDRFQAFDVGRRTFFLEAWLYQPRAEYGPSGNWCSTSYERARRSSTFGLVEKAKRRNCDRTRRNS